MAAMKVRLGAVKVALALAVLVVWSRAAQLQIVEGSRHQAEALARRTERITLPAPRGGIYDRNGIPLALTQETFHLGIAPNEINDARWSAEEVSLNVREIATSLDLPLADVDRAVRGSGYAYFHGPFTSAQIRRVREIPGVHAEPVYSRLHPDADLARPLLGWPSSPGRPASGIERVLDSLLAGVPGSAVVLRDMRGRRYESPARLDAFPSRGSDVFLTIDAELQDIVESALLDALVELEASSGDVVVMDPATGEVLALASMRADGTSQMTALTDPYEPGSTAKLFVAAALLERDLASEVDSVWGELGEFDYAGRTIRDVHEMGWGTLSTVIELSSNIGIVKFAQRLPPEIQFGVLRDFGFGSPSGIEYPSESRGILRRPREWSGFSQASLAMGYEFAATPVQLAAAYSVIASGGLLLRPTLVSAVRGPDGDMLYEHRPEPVRRVLSEANAAKLRQMLIGVVYGQGTASLAALTSYELAGKTGTSRRAGASGYIAGAYTASFASMFPASDPQLVTVVKLVDPRGTYGSVTAAPVTRTVIEQALAAQTGAIDRIRLLRERDVDESPDLSDRRARVYRFAWPRVERLDMTDSVTVVPQVAGMYVREAAKTLHQSGLRAVIDGLGLAAGTSPPAGDSVSVNSLIRIAAVSVLDR